MELCTAERSTLNLYPVKGIACRTCFEELALYVYGDSLLRISANLNRYTV
jgi:hypothetical protein